MLEFIRIQRQWVKKPFFESTEVMTLRSMLALETYRPTASAVSASFRACLEKANRWLKQNQPTDTTQTAALRLLVDVQAGKRGKGVASGIEDLLKRQNTDGHRRSQPRSGAI